MEGGSEMTAPSEVDREVIEDFFMEHCRSSQDRLGRLDVDCWAVTRRLVSFLLKLDYPDDKDVSQSPRRVRWVIRKPISVLREQRRSHPIKRRMAQIFRRRLHEDEHQVSKNEKSRQKRHRLTNYQHHTVPTSAVIETSTISHWVVEWKGYIVDATVMQFVELDSILDNAGTDALRKRCYSDDSLMTFKSCSDIHPPWVHELVSRGAHYKEYAQSVATRPYFFGKESEHPIRCHADVVKVDMKHDGGLNKEG